MMLFLYMQTSSNNDCDDDDDDEEDSDEDGIAEDDDDNETIAPSLRQSTLTLCIDDGSCLTGRFSRWKTCQGTLQCADTVCEHGTYANLNVIYSMSSFPFCTL